MIPHIKETVITIRKKHCDLGTRIYYTFEGPEYTRDIVFYDSLVGFLKYYKIQVNLKLKNFRDLRIIAISSGQ